ncbi:ABC transporter ATP-binding protein [Acidovorax sp. GBBC 3334]|uniref:ABC transporter ATP-binding protein n=1 Tax=Acidovorax sp. GBBC 3334 TaxID=2940496 RepID=UPI002303A327|nr:ABC transporter ATP-binding protein [Acidovorax sp. GBBC 3334]MDA8453137.1 ABC transporter ATP-binding protein [Acidovorax sp. GBBC 3334]
MAGGLQAEGLGWQSPRGDWLLQGVTVQAAAGECVAVAGPNGAGKSTLLKLLAGRLAPAEGAARWQGQDMARWSAVERARSVAVLGQDDAAQGGLRARDYVALGRLPHEGRVSAGEHARAVDDALRTCGVDALADRRLGSLSGGERQRLHLARALAQEPALLLLDEPTNHLDLAARADVLALVRGLGITVVAVLHELSLVPSFADRAWVLQAGRLVAEGPPAEALRRECVSRVFGMELVRTRHPRHGGTLWSFEREAA